MPKSCIIYAVLALNGVIIMADILEKFNFQLNKRSVAMIVLGVIINIMGRSIALYYHLPLFLDSIGTFLVAIVLGPVGGAISGTIMNFIVAAWPSWEWSYCLVSIAGAIVVGLILYKRERMDSFTIVGCSVLTGIVMTVASTPLNLLIRDGMTGNDWGDAMVELLEQYISLKSLCCIAGELIVNIPDKIIILIFLSFGIVMFRKAGITMIPEKDGEKKEKSSSNKIPMIIVAIAVPLTALSFSTPVLASVEDFVSDYATTVYGVYEGLSSAEINTVTQTGDGYIWAGAYSGLYRYNGTNFEQMDLDPRISNAIVLRTDKKGRLWIGTNDSGVACYDTYRDTIRFFTSEDGLPSDSIREICEDGQGNIYVATASYICRIDALSGSQTAGDTEVDAEVIESNDDVNITVYDSLTDITSVYSMVCLEDGSICGVTATGTLFLMRDGEIVYTLESKTDGQPYTCVAYRGEGHYLVGTAGDTMEFLHLEDGGFVKTKTIKTDMSGFNRMYYSERYGGYFVTAISGLCFVSASGVVQDLSMEGFNTSVEDLLIDKQGNIWFSSSKQGILKLSKNPFSDLYKRIGQPAQVVNAIIIDGDYAYIGTDNGAVKVDLKNNIRISDEILEDLGEVRIRDIMQDSKGNLWFCTYGEEGLVRIDPNGNKKSFTEETDSSVLGSRFRLAKELSDGRIFAVSTSGINFIDDDKVVLTIGADDGMAVPKALSVVEAVDGTLWVGTDGDGVYTIVDDKVKGHWGRDEGLLSGVVMKMVACRGGRLYVTSNGLYYHSDKGITKLDNFPYNNVYDAYITEDGTAYITSSAGLYVTREDDLLKNDEDYTYALLNSKRGLTTTFTANSFNCVEGDRMLFCCTDGVQILNTDAYRNFDEHYQIVIKEMSKEGVPISIENGVYNIPAGAGSLMITPGILNYTVSDPLVKVTLVGVDTEGRIMRQSAMESIYYPSLAPGDYKLSVQVMDDAGVKPEKEMDFLIHKDAMLHEQPYYKTYIVVVITIMIAFIVWLMSKMGNMAVINRQYDQIRAAKEEAEYANQAKSKFLAQMSHEIRTPINAVMGMDEMILRESRDPDIRAYARDIYDAGNVLLSLINDILDTTKIESGKMEIVPVEYGMKKLIQDLVNLTSQRAQAKDIKLELEIDPDLPKVLYGDDVRIRQVITNILTNAVKYTMTGTVWFRIKGARSGEKIRLHVEVEDTGIGIKEEDLPKLFEEYRRIEEGRNRSIEGTGLGMTITVKLLKLMGSRLEVSSIYGKGSKFYFDLDQKVIDSTPIGYIGTKSRTEEVYAASYEPFTAEEAKVLVVDDNSMNRKVFRNLLKPTRVRVSEAASGPESLVMVENEHYDVIFMDHMMPEMDGVETMQRMRKMECCNGIPIYVLTANVMSGAKESYMSMGFDGFISKPIIAGNLEDTLRAALPAEYVHPLSDEEKEALKADSRTAGNPVPEDLPDVEGLDWSYAWLHLPERDMLRGSVESFYEVINAQADRLQELYVDLVTHAGNMNAAALKGDGENGNGSADDPVAAYRIQVHSMKSSAATIGIVPLAGMANVLESAARNNDIEIIRALHGPFIKEWKSYEDKMRGAFGLGLKAKTEAVKEDVEVLKAMLDLLEPKISELDVDGADEIMEKMKKCSFAPEVDELIPKLGAAVMDLNEELAVSIINEMRGLL